MQETQKIDITRSEILKLLIKTQMRWICNIVKFLILLLFVIISFAIFPTSGDAANLYFSPSSNTYSVDVTFSVNVYVSSLDQAMNAASAVISFPQDKLEAVSLSKNGSIFSLWVQEPSFSNNEGKVSFEGIVFNPGFTGASGKVITITFRTKAAGSASLVFSSASVLANDGKGTNILTGLGSAIFSVDGGRTIIMSETAGTPFAPEVRSPTHPDSNKWYAVKDAKFIWDLPKDASGVRLLVGRMPNAVPTVTYIPPIHEKEITDLEDGIWYFSVRLRNGVGWGGISNFKFQIDTQPPKPFKIEVKEGKETTNPQPTLYFETTDETSGIEHYEVIIDNRGALKIGKGEYKIPDQDLGKHIVVVKAVDKAGNETLAMTEFEILPIETPVITDYPRELLSGSVLSIKGKAIPETRITLFVQKDKREIKREEIKSDKEGKWVFIDVEPAEKGVYQVWAEAVDSFGSRSNPSEKISILVNPPAFIRIGRLMIDYLTIITTLLLLVLGLVFLIFSFFLFWKKRKKKLERELNEVEKAMYQAFKALREEVGEQVAKLDGKPGLSERERKICDDLKKALKISEELIGRKINDIERKIKN